MRSALFVGFYATLLVVSCRRFGTKFGGCEILTAVLVKIQIIWDVSKFRRPSKIVPNSTRLWKLLKIAEFKTPTPQDVRKKGSKILKLPSVRNCFTLAMTNKLVVIMDSLKVPKINKILLYEMKFLVPNYSCLQNPWLGGYRPQIPVLSVLNWICWTPSNKIPGYATDSVIYAILKLWLTPISAQF